MAMKLANGESLDIPEVYTCKIHNRLHQLLLRPQVPRKWGTLQILIHVFLHATWEHKLTNASSRIASNQFQQEQMFLSVNKSQLQIMTRLCCLTYTCILLLYIELVSLALAVISTPSVLTAATITLTGSSFLALIDIYFTIKQIKTNYF